MSHQAVLINQIVQAFDHIDLHYMIDGTAGAGGHAQALLEKHPEIRGYLAIDQDPVAIALLKEKLRPWEDKVIIQKGNFALFEEYLKTYAWPAPNGILLDLGVSSMQLDQAERGFSFMREGPLDMRMDPEIALSAADIVNTWSEQELARIFRDYGEEKRWRAAAKAIVNARVKQPFTTTTELVDVLLPVLKVYGKQRIHPLTLVFQALRICVNRELQILESVLPKAIHRLEKGGSLAVISFHSLEDRLVKCVFRDGASDKLNTTGLAGLFQDKEPTVEILTKKPIMASEEECVDNPRSRSAKLRIARKL